MERGQEKKRDKREKREREQCGHAAVCCLLVYLFSPSTQQQLSQHQEDSFALNQGCGKIFRYTHAS